MSEKTSLYLRSVGMICAICLIVGLLLAGVYAITSPIIAERELKKQQAALYEIFPNASGFEDISSESMPQTMTSLFKTKEGDGFVAYIQTNTQYGTSSFALGIDAATLTVTVIKEITYGDSIHFGADYLPSFAGKGEDTLADIATNASPAKITRNAVKNAVADALLYVGELLADPNAPEQDPEELAELFPSASGFEKLALSGQPSSLTALYKTAEGDGYVAFLKFKGYSNSDTEIAISINAQTKQILNIVIIKYVDSYDVREKDPAFLPSLIGKDLSQLAEIDTSATPPVTKAAFKAAIIDALTYLESMGGNN